MIVFRIIAAAMVLTVGLISIDFILLLDSFILATLFWAL
jgi:hypothetical protein